MRKHPLLAFATATSFALSSAVTVGPEALQQLNLPGRSVATAAIHVSQTSTAAAVLVTDPTALPRRRVPIRSRPREIDRLLRAGVLIGTVVGSVVPRPTARLVTAKLAIRPATVARVITPARPVTRRSVIAKAAVLSGVWRALRVCESGNDYGENTGNGYYGAYQFSLRSWWSVGYSGLPSQAPSAVQDAAAKLLLSRSGWRAWPECSIELGLR